MQPISALDDSPEAREHAAPAVSPAVSESPTTTAPDPATVRATAAEPLTAPADAPPQAQCQCPAGADGMLPPRKNPLGADWTCGTCGLPRRYYVKLVVFNGGTVDRCADCLYEWQRPANRKNVKPAPTLVRSVCYTTCTAGTWRSSHTCVLCDPCVEKEKTRWAAGGGEIHDGRETTSAKEAARG